MKIAKRVLALVVTLLMIVSTCAIAASAASTLQAAINAGSSYKLTANVHESVVINKDFTLDLNGYALVGEPGKVAVTITGGNVTITNGQVEARFAEVDSATMLETVVSKSPAAIRVNGGSLTVEGVRVTGSYTRIPTQTKYSFPTGSAIESTNGAVVTLKKASLFGRYGVNAKVSTKSLGGTVIVEDAVVVGFMMGIKGTEVLGEGTEKVNAADHINGALNGPKLTENELNIVKTLMDDRAYIYTKPVTSDAVVTGVEGDETYTITATVDASNVWKNNTSTDCSYKYIPDYAVLSNGSLVKMTSADGETYTAEIAAEYAEGAQVRYRTWAVMQPDVAKYAKNARAYINKAFDMLKDKMDYAWFTNEYNDVIAQVADLWDTVEAIPNPENNGQIGWAIAESDEFKSLEKALFALGGVTMINGNKDVIIDGDNYGKYYIGKNQRYVLTGSYEAKEAYAPLDAINRLKDEFDATYGTLEDTSKWGDVALWVYENTFKKGGLIDILGDTRDAVQGLIDVLEDENVAELVELADLGDKVELLGTATVLAEKATEAYDYAMSNSSVKNILDKVEARKVEIPYYVNKIVGVFENLDTYITPERLVNGDDLMAWAVYADAELDIEPAPVLGNVKVDVEVIGAGKVTTTTGEGTTGDMIAHHDGMITLTATADAGSEFLYWANNAGNIISTQASLTLVTMVDRELSAVFGDVEEPSIIFASTTGNVVGVESYYPGDGDAISLAHVDKIDIAGYKFNEWPGQSGNAIADADAVAALAETTYYAGAASAFGVEGARYDSMGHVLAVRPGSEALILIPSFEADGDCTVTYIDGDKEISTEVAIGKTVTYTATGANFSYWVDAEGRVVSLNKTYSHQVIRTATFTAVYGAEAPAYAINIVHKASTDVRDTFYAERTVKAGMKVLSNGIIFAPVSSVNDIDTDLVVNSTNAAMKKGTSRDNSNNGTYYVGLTKANFPYAVILRPYVEIEGVGVVYGPTVTKG